MGLKGRGHTVYDEQGRCRQFERWPGKVPRDCRGTLMMSRRGVAFCDEGGDARQHAAPSSRGTWPWSAISIDSSPEWRSRIARTVAVERMSELAPRITRTGTRASASKSFHSGGQRTFDVEIVNRACQSHIIGRHQFSVVDLPGAACGPSHCSAVSFGNCDSDNCRRISAPSAKLAAAAACRHSP